MTELDLHAIQQRADAATPGPWYQGRDSVRYESSFEAWTRRDPHDPDSYDLFPVTGNSADAEFIAHARTDIPALINRIRELEAHNARLHTAYVNAVTDGEGPR